MPRLNPDDHPRKPCGPQGGRFVPAGRGPLRQGVFDGLSAQALLSLGVDDSEASEWHPGGMNPRTYSGWKVLEPERLLATLRSDGLAPRHAITDLEHVTYLFPDDEFAPPVTSARIVGWASDDGLDVLAVEVDGTTERPDGGVFHITYSLDEGREARESNDLLAGGWEPIGPYPLHLGPFTD